MRRPSVYWIAAFCGFIVFTTSGQGRSAQRPSATAQSDAVTPRAEIYPKLEDAFLRWPLPAGAERYGAIRQSTLPIDEPICDPAPSSSASSPSERR